MAPPVRIGARGSRLSQAQSRTIQARIAAALGADPAVPAEVERVAPLILITTSGDRIQDRRLLDEGGKGLFTKEIEAALATGEIDAAVHSLKDVPSLQPPGLVLAAHPEREDPRDAFCSLAYGGLQALPQGARLGTASLRRQAQSLHRRPDLELVLMRGNVDTRLSKLAGGEADAILLALAGLKRLGLADHVREVLDPVEAPPAPGQGALAIQTRSADVGAAWLAALRHEPTMLTIAAERGALEALEGSCRTAIGAHAVLNGSRLSLIVEALTPDGGERWRREGVIDLSGRAEPEAAAHALGLDLGRAIRDEAGDRLLLGHD